jgi:hypothetical protein
MDAEELILCQGAAVEDEHELVVPRAVGCDPVQQEVPAGGNGQAESLTKRLLTSPASAPLALRCLSCVGTSTQDNLFAL